MPTKKKIEYGLVLEFPLKDAFGDFEKAVAKILCDGSGAGFGMRDLSRYYKTPSARDKAEEKVREIAKNHKIKGIKFHRYEYEPV